MKNKKEILDFISIMKQLTESGLSVYESLEIASMTESNTKGIKPATVIFSKVSKGTSLGEAFHSCKDIFPEFIISAMRISDIIGNASDVLQKLKSYYEKQENFIKKITDALVYPVLVLFVSFIIMLLCGIFVLPKIKEMFAEFGTEAAETLNKSIMNLETQISSFIFLIFTVFFILFILFFLKRKNSTFNLIFDKIVLKIPFAGNFLLYKELMIFFYAMEILAESRLPMDIAIAESAETIGNRYIADIIYKIKDKTEKGKNLSESFREQKLFPEYVCKWISIGDKTGEPSPTFIKIRIYFENKIDKSAIYISKSAEPIITMFLGLLLIFIVIKIVVPIITLYGNLGL